MMKTWTRRVALVVALMTLGSLISIAPASAAPLAFTVNPASVAAGGQFTVSGPADCIDSTVLHITVTQLTLEQTVSGAAAWSVTFTVPANTAPGTYTVSMFGNECTFSDGAIIVAAAIPTTTTTAAPTTTAARTTTAPAAEAKAVTADPTFTN